MGHSQPARAAGQWNPAWIVAPSRLAASAPAVPATSAITDEGTRPCLPRVRAENDPERNAGGVRQTWVVIFARGLRASRLGGRYSPGAAPLHATGERAQSKPDLYPGARFRVLDAGILASALPLEVRGLTARRVETSADAIGAGVGSAAWLSLPHSRRKLFNGSGKGGGALAVRCAARISGLRKDTSRLSCPTRSGRSTSVLAPLYFRSSPWSARTAVTRCSSISPFLALRVSSREHPASGFSVGNFRRSQYNSTARKDASFHDR